ncbi:MAG: hypothetical protein KDK39_17100 [Leptospiraceae bacterium]|nr:hypothetical protein [Leptospiraceae bacterium]
MQKRSFTTYQKARQWLDQIRRLQPAARSQPAPAENTALPACTDCPYSSAFMVYQFGFSPTELRHGNERDWLEIRGVYQQAEIFWNQCQLRFFDHHQDRQPILGPFVWHGPVPGPCWSRSANMVLIITHSPMLPVNRIESVQIKEMAAVLDTTLSRTLWQGWQAGVFSIAAVFGIFSWLFNRRRTSHLAAAVLAGLVVCYFLPALMEGLAVNKTDQGTDLWFFHARFLILCIALPGAQFWFYDRLYPRLPATSVSGQHLASKTILRGIGNIIRLFRVYALTLLIIIGIIILSMPLAKQLECHFCFQILFDWPALLVTLLQLLLAVHHGRAAAKTALILSALFSGTLWVDLNRLLLWEDPATGTLGWGMLVMTVNFILILAINRFASNQDERVSRQILQQSNLRLREAGQQKTAFIVRAARELKEPLLNISGQMLALLGRTDWPIPQEARAQLIAIIEQNSQIQRRFERIVLLFNDPDNLKREFQMLQMGEILDYFHLTATKGYKDIGLEIHVSADPPVRAHRQLLLTMFNELLQHCLQKDGQARIRILVWQKNRILHVLWEDPVLTANADRLQQHLQISKRSIPPDGNLELGISLIWRIAELHDARPRFTGRGNLLLEMSIGKSEMNNALSRLDTSRLQIAFLQHFGRGRIAAQHVAQQAGDSLLWRRLRKAQSSDDIINEYLHRRL